MLSVLAGIRMYFLVFLIYASAFITNRTPMDGSGNATPWIKWLPWGHPKRKTSNT